MKIKFTTILLLTLSQFASAQHTITVRPQHQKELIYTLREGEFISRNESQLLLSLSGCDYEILTQFNQNYYLVNRSGRAKSEMSPYIPYSYKNWKITVDKDNYTVRSRNSDKKYGPFKNIQTFYDYDKTSTRTFTTHTTTSDLFAFKYSEPVVTSINGIERKENKYFVVRPGEAPRGPYNDTRIFTATSESFIYAFETEEGEFLSENSVIKGPYQDTYFMPSRVVPGSEILSPSYFFYKIDDVWKYDHPLFSAYSFRDRPRLTYLSDTYMVTAEIIEKGNVNYRLMPNGELVEQSATSFHHVNNNHEMLNFKAIDTLNGSSETKRYFVSYKGNELGIFGFRTDIPVSQFGKDCDFFSTALIPLDSISGELSQFQACYFSPSLGLTAPFTFKQNDKMYFYGSNYGQMSPSDSSFTVNGNVRYENVLRLNFSEYPQNWWITYLENGFKRFYRNGKPYTGIAPDQIVRRQSANQPFDMIEIDNQFFLKPINSTKLLGPVDRNSTFSIANDKTTYAECKNRSRAIMIQNKAISEGFNLIYNPKLDAFHWLRIADNNQIYLHTYELN